MSAQSEEVLEEEQLAEPMMVYKEDGKVSQLFCKRSCAFKSQFLTIDY